MRVAVAFAEGIRKAVDFVAAHLVILGLIVAAIAVCIALARRKRARQYAADAGVREARVAALDAFIKSDGRPRARRLGPPR